jgi:putative transposase
LAGNKHMSGNKCNISKEQIEKEIIKTFALFKKQKNISTAEYLKHFDVSLFSTKKYRKIRYSYESLIKLYLFKKIKGIKFYTNTTKYLKRNPAVKWKLGFSKTPERSTINYFVNRILENKTKNLLIYTSEKIIEISEKFEIIFDIDFLKSDKKPKKTKKRNQYIIKDKRTRDTCKLFKKRIAPFINLKQNYNTIYKKNTFINLLIHLGLTQDFAENGSKIFREIRKKGPDADTLFYHLKKYDNIKELQNMFIRVFEVVWNMAKQANIIKRRKRFDVAIDYTEWPYYGKQAKMVTGKKPERGTCSCYKFATISIVEPTNRFTLLALPVSPVDNKEIILTKLLNYTYHKIKIKHIYLDRGFYDSTSINSINKFHLKYLIPAIQSKHLNRIIEIIPAPKVIEDYTLKHIKINLIILEDKEKIKRVFATNLHFDENDVNLSDRLFKLYSKRWGIETSYRVKKHSFRGKTTSKTYIIRLFYFLFSVLLYNLWILADILIQIHLYGNINNEHILKSKYFGTLLMIIDPG